MAVTADQISAPAQRKRSRRLPLAHAGLGLALCTIVAGLVLPTGQYLTPRSGAGYALGIVGGSMMLALLIYPLRKRARGLTWLGSVRGWFRIHMILGVAGPLAILYHCNFSLGATNSNVALVCMLIVASSGLVGRYLYGRIHHGLYGRKATLKELARSSEELRSQSGALKLLPGLVAEIEASEQKIGRAVPLLAQPLVAAWRCGRERRRIHRQITAAIAAAARRSPVIGAERRRFTETARRYVDSRLTAARRVAEFEACARLFAAWHILHLPLFAMLLVVGVVHVIAVHLY